MMDVCLCLISINWNYGYFKKKPQKQNFLFKENKIIKNSEIRNYYVLNIVLQKKAYGIFFFLLVFLINFNIEMKIFTAHCFS